jgi:hypothetical protein
LENGQRLRENLRDVPFFNTFETHPIQMHLHGYHFKDEHGRTLTLRGVNLGGSRKVPFKPNGATYGAKQSAV